MKSASSSSSGQSSTSTPSNKVLGTNVVKTASQLIRTQAVRKQTVHKTNQFAHRLLSKKMSPINKSPGSLKQNYIQVKTGTMPTGSKVSVGKPITSVNGNAKLLGNSSSLKIATAGGPKKTIITTKKIVKSNEPPIIIKVRTLKPDEEILRKSKLEEEDKKIGTRKVIKVNTQSNEKRAIKLRHVNRDSLDEDSDDTMDSEDDLDEEEEDEEDDDSDIDDPDASNGKQSSWRDKNVRLLTLCEDAIDSLKQRQKSYNALASTLKTIDKRTLDKFVRLSDEIASTIKKVIKEDGENLSDADHFEEYCQDVLDSIAFKGDEEDMSQEESEKILLWLHKKEGDSGKSKKDPELNSNELMLYTQILELLTAANTDDGLDKLNSSLGEDIDEGEEEQIEEEEEENMSQVEEEEDEEDVEDEDVEDEDMEFTDNEFYD